MSAVDLTRGREISFLAEREPAPADDSTSGQLLRAAHELIGQGETGIKFRQATAEFAATLVAGVSGAVVWSLGTAATRGLGRAGTLGLAMTVGGMAKYGVKAGVESLLLDPEHRTASSKDLAWGAVDGLAGVAGSIAERHVSRSFLRSLGRRHLGADISENMAVMAGEKIVAQTIASQVKHNFLRGVGGGAMGSFVWSIPHSVENNWSLIKERPLAGLNAAKNQILSDTVTGTVAGGLIAGGGTVLLRGPEAARYGLSRLRGDRGMTRLDITHLNDLHSELVGSHGLPRIATKLDDLRAQSAANGRSHHFYVAGDSESGNVVFAFTRGGLVENEALARMKMQGIIPGNHPYDISGGGYDVHRYVKVMTKVNEGRNLPLLAANLDLSSYPDYQKLVKPYIIHEIVGRNGPQKVGVIGLITDEGAVGKIGYKDAAATAEHYVGELHKQGVDNIVVLSHLGLTEDIALARRVKGISAIVGGHSHDFEPVPRWVRQGSGEYERGVLGRAWSRLTGRGRDPYAGWEVPIVQAGSNGRWLGELNLAFRPGGAADRFATTGTLHPITNKVPAHREIERFVNSHLDDLQELRNIEFNAEAVAPYSLGGIRARETPLGNLISDSMLSGLRKHLGPEAVDIVLMNSGGIRAGIKANDPITRLDLANIFMNAGKPQHEVKEFFIVQMTGRQIREALEYGIRDMTAPEGITRQNLPMRLYQLLKDPPPPSYAAEPGNFLQVSGLKYSFDLSREPLLSGLEGSGRVSGVSVKNQAGQFVPIADDQVYKVAARLHAIAKWHMHGIFGPQRHFKQSLALLNGENTRLSQVDLLAEYIQGRTLDPNKIGRVEGRINDLTPRAWVPTLRPGISLTSYAAMSARQPYLEPAGQPR